MTKIEKEFGNIDGQKSFLFISKAERLQDNINDTLRCLIGKGMIGAYICLNKSYKSVCSLLESKKISTKNLLFIDTLTGSKTELKAKDGVIIISNPSELTSIALAVTSYAKSNPKNKFILIDALSTLLIYNQPEVVAKFTRQITSLTSSDKIKVIMFTIESPDDRILSKVEPFFDKIIRL